MTTQASAEQLAAWLAKNEPGLFNALMREAATQAARDSGQLSGILDWFKTAGSAIGSAASTAGGAVTNAVKAVGGYLASEQGMNTLATLGTAYVGYKTQKNVLETQMQLASAGLSPAPITNVPSVANPSVTVPVYTPTNQVATDQLLYQLRPTFFEQYKVPLLIGGGLLALFVALR